MTENKEESKDHDPRSDRLNLAKQLDALHFKNSPNITNKVNYYLNLSQAINMTTFDIDDIRHVVDVISDLTFEVEKEKIYYRDGVQIRPKEVVKVVSKETLKEEYDATLLYFILVVSIYSAADSDNGLEILRTLNLALFMTLFDERLLVMWGLSDDEVKDIATAEINWDSIPKFGSYLKDNISKLWPSLKRTTIDPVLNDSIEIYRKTRPDQGTQILDSTKAQQS